jgi:hypothetical protein
MKETNYFILIPVILTFISTVLLGVLSFIKDAKRLKFEEDQLEYQRLQKEKAEKLERDMEERAKATDTKLESKFDIIIERVMSLEEGQYKLNEAFTAHTVSSEVKESFEVGIERATDGVALDIIKSNFTVNTNVKAMIIKWGNLMHKLAGSFHGSDTRKEDKKGDAFSRSEELLEKRNLIVSEFNNYINSKFPSMKTSHKREKIIFSDLLVNERVYSSFDILMAELEINGLDDAGYIKKFEIQVRKFCKNLLVALEVWNSFEASVIFNKEKEDAA